MLLEQGWIASENAEEREGLRWRLRRLLWIRKRLLWIRMRTLKCLEARVSPYPTEPQVELTAPAFP